MLAHELVFCRTLSPSAHRKPLSLSSSLLISGIPPSGIIPVLPPKNPAPALVSDLSPYQYKPPLAYSVYCWTKAGPNPEEWEREKEAGLVVDMEGMLSAKSLVGAGRLEDWRRRMALESSTVCPINKAPESFGSDHDR